MHSLPKLPFGILGTGRIAAQFATGLNASKRCTLAAVASRSADTAKAFAATHRVPVAHDSYTALLADPEVHAVYISLPNAMHHEWTLKALAAGKHVLCEKPVAVNAAQAREMFDASRKHGRLLMEGFMYRSHPQTHAVCRAVSDGRIGKLRMIRLSHVFSAAKVAGSIKFSTALAGGSLMDVGCYCLSYARLLAASEPASMAAVAHLHESGVDEYAVGTLGFPGGILASFACGMTVRGDNTAYVLGTDGHLEIPAPWKPPAADAQFTIVRSDGTREVRSVSSGIDLYGGEADDFAAGVLDGKPLPVSFEDTLGNQRCLDELRRQVGLPF